MGRGNAQKVGSRVGLKRMGTQAAESCERPLAQHVCVCGIGAC